MQCQGPPPPWHSPDDWMAELLSAAVLYLSSPLLPVFANNTKLCKTDEILTMCCSICTQLLPHIRWLDLSFTMTKLETLAYLLLFSVSLLLFSTSAYFIKFQLRWCFQKVICRCQVTSEQQNLIWCLKSDCSAADMLSIHWRLCCVMA